MRITVRVTPNAKKPAIISEGAARYHVRVNAKPVDGAANIRLFEMLAAHFQVPFAALRLVSGATSRQKIIEIIQ